MIDDIISFGGTLAYSADELKRLGFKHVYAYATHVENSVLDEENGTLLKRLNDGTVERIYTTESLYSGNHEKITILS
jgi:ribose-phosphate pyrophosphokinase